MTDLDSYLARYYLDAARLACSSAISDDELDTLVLQRLVPAPSYVVTDTGTVRSFVFGEMAAPGATPGRYFHPSQSVWIAHARRAAAAETPETPHDRLKSRFCANYSAALATLNLATWRLHDSFDDKGAPIVEGLQRRVESAWEYFLNGTFGLCVANPISEAHIAYKEVLQEKLAHQSENGKRTEFPVEQIAAMHELIDAYAAATMPFSPIEYKLSSRKRMVEDLRATMRVSNT